MREYIDETCPDCGEMALELITGPSEGPGKWMHAHCLHCGWVGEVMTIEWDDWWERPDITINNFRELGWDIDSI